MMKETCSSSKASWSVKSGPVVFSEESFTLNDNEYPVDFDFLIHYSKFEK